MRIEEAQKIMADENEEEYRRKEEDFVTRASIAIKCLKTGHI